MSLTGDPLETVEFEGPKPLFLPDKEQEATMPEPVEEPEKVGV